jgi:p-aminobenzoyl-glutamate transporter AbgT
VALLIEHSFAMFASPRGTWLPLSSVFAVTLAIGIATRRRFARELMRATVEDRDAALQGLR